MNSNMVKMEELFNRLTSIENSYSVGSPGYKFNYVFYNIVESPVERPQDFPMVLWNKYYIPNSKLMPVILNREQIDERKRQQNELIAKLNDSKGAILKKTDSLKTKREVIKSKLENVAVKFRMKLNKNVYGEPSEQIFKIQPEIFERERLTINSKKETLLDYLIKTKEQLEEFKKRVSQAVVNAEKKHGIYK